MSDVTTTSVSRYRPKARPRIEAEGDSWGPRSDFAENVLGVTDRTAKRMNFRTVYVAGIAYVPYGESLREVVARARRHNEPAKHRYRKSAA